ncbi:MAG: hypothetical protein FD135_2348 [Comamonadaceae bacterium]|nr:MAG: hypothetical protein FD135_2348 [Comamonadaceae bacterium]
MHPEDIKAAIRKKGFTAAVVADHMEVSRSTVAQVISGRATSARIKDYIAQITGLSVDTLWPPKPVLVLRRPTPSVPPKSRTHGRHAGAAA